MITPDRLSLYKTQALRAVAARANKPEAAGISMVSITPHDLLALILAFEETLAPKETPDGQS